MAPSSATTATASPRSVSRRRGSSRRYWPTGSPFQAAPGTLDYFLTERYCLYTTRRGTPIRVEIHHRPWPLQRAEAAMSVETMTAAGGVPHGSETPVLHFAKRIDVVAWPPRAVDVTASYLTTRLPFMPTTKWPGKVQRNG